MLQLGYDVPTELARILVYHTDLNQTNYAFEPVYFYLKQSYANKLSCKLVTASQAITKLSSLHSLVIDHSI